MEIRNRKHENTKYEAPKHETPKPRGEGNSRETWIGLTGDWRLETGDWRHYCRLAAVFLPFAREEGKGRCSFASTQRFDGLSLSSHILIDNVNVYISLAHTRTMHY